MNNEEILKRLETKDKNYPELKKKYPIFAEEFKGILRDIRNEALQEAQKQSVEEIKDLKQQLSNVNKIIDDRIKETENNIKVNEQGILLNDINLEFHRWNKHANEEFLRLLKKLKASLSKGDVHTQRTKVTEPLDKADESGSRISSAPKDFKLSPDFIGDNLNDMEIGTICPLKEERSEE